MIEPSLYELSLDCWSHDVQSMHFASILDLLQFVAKSQKQMDRVIKDNEHDRVSFFLDFYEGFKSQDLPLIEYFAAYREKRIPDENRPDCIGRFLKLKQFLSQELENEYPGLKDKLYGANNTFDFRKVHLKLTKEMEENYHYFVNFNEHIVLTLKIEVNGRIGFVLFEMSFLNSVPVIAMVDNQYPSHVIVQLPKARYSTYTCTGENYVRVQYDKKEGAGEGVTGSDVFELAFYVGGNITRPDLSAKHALVPNVQYKYVFGGDSLVANVSRYGESEWFNLQRWDEEIKDVVRSKIPVSYFIQKDSLRQDYEEELRKVALMLREPLKELRSWMIAVARIQQDQQFQEEYDHLSITLMDTRKTLVQKLREK